MTTLNASGAAHLLALVDAGAVDKTSAWSFSAEDGDAMLGADGGNWEEFSKWHLALHTDVTGEDKNFYRSPFGKDGKVCRAALVSIKERAYGRGDAAVELAADIALKKIDAPETPKEQQDDAPETPKEQQDEVQRSLEPVPVLGNPVGSMELETIDPVQGDKE